jgi:hypothetical protein
MKWCNLFVLSLLSFLSLSQKNDFSVVGKVLNQNKAPVEGVLVKIKGGDEVEITNDSGEFVFNNLSEGKYILIVSKVGVNTVMKTFNLGDTSQSNLYVDVYQYSELINEVSVVEKTDQTKIKESSWSVESIAVNNLKNSTLDVNTVLSSSSGINLRENGGVGSEFNFSLNGLNDYRVRFFIDEVPIDYLGEAFRLNNLPVNLVERVDVYKGVVPVELGADALGGAVNLITSNSKKSYLDLSYSLGSFNTQHFTLNSQYRNPKNGFTIKPRAFLNYSANNL